MLRPIPARASRRPARLGAAVVAVLGLGTVAQGAVPAPGPADEYAVFAVRYGTLRGFPLRSLVLGADSSARVDIAMMLWVIRGSDRVLLVDAGVYRQELLRSWSIEDFVKPSEAIAPLGIAPEAVTDVILTHLHWDHADGADLFPNARIWVQRDEYRHFADPANLPRSGVFAVDMEMLRSVEAAGRLRLVPGDSIAIAPGVVVYTGGRHTRESQYVTVATGGGPVVLASDNVYLYANLDRQRPIAATWDSMSNLAAQRRMRSLAGDAHLIVPGHDAAVFSRFATVAPGIVRIP